MSTSEVLLCTDTFLDDHGDRLATVAPSLKTVEFTGLRPVDAADLESATMAFLSKDALPDRVRGFLTAAAAAPNLRWLHVMSAGVEGATFDAFRDRGVLVTRTPGASASAIAETVFMYLHALTRGVRALDEAYAARRWDWTTWRQLEGRTITVLGYGPIGRRILRLAGAYDMVPRVVRQTVTGDEPCPAYATDRLAEAVSGVDVLVVALPLTLATEGLVSGEIIAALAPDALVVNVARGPIVDQGALTNALASGRLGGAGLDVFDVEPLPADDRLWTLPNVILTPHNSGSSNLGPSKVAEMFFEHLVRYLDDPRSLQADPGRPDSVS